MAIAVIGFGLATLFAFRWLYWSSEFHRPPDPRAPRQYPRAYCQRVAARAFFWFLLSMILGALGYIASLLERAPMFQPRFP
jgi:hypothetical protein